MADKKLIVPLTAILAVGIVSLLAYKAIESLNTLSDPFDFSEEDEVDEDF